MLAQALASAWSAGLIRSAAEPASGATPAAAALRKIRRLIAGPHAPSGCGDAWPRAIGPPHCGGVRGRGGNGAVRKAGPGSNERNRVVWPQDWSQVRATHANPDGPLVKGFEHSIELQPANPDRQNTRTLIHPLPHKSCGRIWNGPCIWSLFAIWQSCGSAIARSELLIVPVRPQGRPLLPAYCRRCALCRHGVIVLRRLEAHSAECFFCGGGDAANLELGFSTP